METKTIVTISRNERLQHTRTWVLQKAGYHVIPLLDDEAVWIFMKTHAPPTVDLVLICHSVPEESRITICNAMRQHHPHSPILMLYNGWDPTAAKVDGSIQNIQSPTALLNMIELLISQAQDPRTAS